MNKLAIIGGGIAGLALAIGLRKAGIEATVYEKSTKERANGHAFMLLENGLSAMRKLGLKHKIQNYGQSIHQFHMKNPIGDKRMFQSMSDSICVRRAALIDLLATELPEENIQYDKAFHHFEKDHMGQVTHACFSDGTKVKADAFIGADGIWSKVRTSIFPNYSMSRVRVREIVSVIKAPELIKKWRHTFLKMTAEEGGLAIGMLPCDDEYMVWYIQYDSHLPQFHGTTLEEQKSYLYHITQNWADPIPELYRLTDFANSYTWHTTDMEPLPCFYKDNVGLIGDAAHVFLTFTSQGVNSALQDAVCLADLIIRNQPIKNIADTFKQYTFMRKSINKSHLQSGRELREQFLYPYQYDNVLNMPLAKINLEKGNIIT